MKNFFIKIYHKYFKNLSSENIFDNIYTSGNWGKDASGKISSGLGSHDKEIISVYIEAVKSFLTEQKEKIIIVDLGCGDFNVGKHFIDYATKIVACDISNVIIKQNQESYHFPNVDFHQLNMAKDSLPKGDIAFIRQVLQHLSNEEIKTIVDKLNTYKPYKHLVITEHLPSHDNFKINIDKPTGAGTRVKYNGGIDLSQAPFNLIYNNEKVLCEVTTPKIKGLLRTTLYTI